MKEIKLNLAEIDVVIAALKEYKNGAMQKIIRRFEKSRKRIKPSSAKSKGRGFQYAICQKIAERFGIEYNQSDDNCLIHSREMGQRGVDIVLRGAMYDKFPFDIECKNQETVCLPEWIRQAKANQRDGRCWALVLKTKKIERPVICLDFDDFLCIIDDFLDKRG